LGNGTSQAAAHVSGTVALLLGVNPHLTPEDVRMILQDTAFDLGVAWEAQGAGLIDAALAVERAKTWP
jgi:subtilisin family serine protease